MDVEGVDLKKIRRARDLLKKGASGQCLDPLRSLAQAACIIGEAIIDSALEELEEEKKNASSDH